MKLGDLFTKLWFCTVPDPEFKCNPEYPCLDVTPVCGFRYQASFIPEDFEGIAGFQLVPSSTLKELNDRLNDLGADIRDVMFRQACADITKDWDVEEGLKKILEEG